MTIPWELVYSIGALALLAAIVWGVMQNTHRNRANDAITEAATRESYRDPEAYKAERKDFEKEVRPS